jgi:hypothetical protein
MAETVRWEMVEFMPTAARSKGSTVRRKAPTARRTAPPLHKPQGWATRHHRRNVKDATSKEQLQKRSFKGQEKRGRGKASGLTRDFLVSAEATLLQEAANRVYNAGNLFAGSR